MAVTILILGGLQMMAGVLFFATGPTSIQQIGGLTAFGFGAVCIGLGAILAQLNETAKIGARR